MDNLYTTQEPSQPRKIIPLNLMIKINQINHFLTKFLAQISTFSRFMNLMMKLLTKMIKPLA